MLHEDAARPTTGRRSPCRSGWPATSRARPASRASRPSSSGSTRPAGASGFFAAVLSASLAAYAGIYVLTPFDLTWQLTYSLERLLLQLLPAAVLVLGTSLGVFIGEHPDRPGS